MMNGSSVKYGWHQRVSGAVGATCRQRSVDSASASLVVGGEGRYLYISFSGWPELASIVREMTGRDGGDSEDAGGVEESRM